MPSPAKAGEFLGCSVELWGPRYACFDAWRALEQRHLLIKDLRNIPNLLRYNPSRCIAYAPSSYKTPRLEASNRLVFVILLKLHKGSLLAGVIISIASHDFEASIGSLATSVVKSSSLLGSLREWNGSSTHVVLHNFRNI